MQFHGRKRHLAERSISAKQIALPRESRTKGPGPSPCITTSFKNRGGKIQAGHPLAVEHGGSCSEERQERAAPTNPRANKFARLCATSSGR